ncbi:MAG: Ni/Fe hydrogenase subunit alpha [Myxococcales bacterium]|nr:Ni/Fe hydrogenase subunit alpha [Myxococcales bacterium]
MSRTITIDPLTRIEGHARVEIELDDAGKVVTSMFRVLDFRGFETFLCGMQVEMMPTITPRICGTCPQTHHLASARTVDKVFGVTPPRAATLLRQALGLAGIIHSHAIHFFALAGPDLILGLDADASQRSIVGLLSAAPEVAKKALRLRTLGARATELIGGRSTHPVSCVAGGLAAPLGAPRLDGLRRIAAECSPLARELVDFARAALLGRRELLSLLPLETNYLGTVGAGGALDLYAGALRFRSADGARTVDMSEDDWAAHIYEEVAPGGYAKRVLCNATGEGQSYRVGALARLNVCDRIDTPLASAELEAFRELGGLPCHETVLYHYARLVELLYASERLAEIVADDEIRSDDVRTTSLGTPRSATAHVEAPRGTLIHDYEVDANGIVTRCNLLVATQQNLAAIDRTIGLSVERLIDQPDGVLLNGIEFGVRCYDPCLSCATHRVGEMRLEVVVRRGGSEVRRARR